MPSETKASRTRRTPPTPDDASRMQYSHTTRATSPGPGPIVYIIITRRCGVVCLALSMMRDESESSGVVVSSVGP